MEEKENSTQDQTEKTSKVEKKIEVKSYQNGSTVLLACISVICVGILIEFLRSGRNIENKCSSTKYWVYSAYNDVDNRNGVLKHVHLVLERIGYEKSSNKTPWTLLWSHDYPFRVLYPHLHRLKPNQKVNHFPGTGFITNKVDLATSKSKYIPKAFKLPLNKTEFLNYAAANRNAMFLEKHNQHRGVYLKNVSEIDMDSGESFVQEYVQRPFLVDGHRFDIGVYVVLSSVDPLRVYWYKGDVLFRYCPAKYYPFDPKNLDKYVVGDDYLPTWEVPSLAHPYTALGFSMKDAFDIYVASKGKDPTRIWDEVQKAIAEVFLMKEKHVVEALKNYPSSGNFFELMRVDLVVDEDSKVFLLEANMSPNLSSAHFPPNQLLYEQVLYNLFSLVGVKEHVRNGSSQSQQPAIQSMVSSQKNIAVWGEECGTVCRDSCDHSNIPVCRLCRPCLYNKLKQSLLKAHTEFLHRGDFRRLLPPAMKPGNTMFQDLHNLTDSNRLQYLWYQGKCNMDITWCT